MVILYSSCCFSSFSTPLVLIGRLAILKEMDVEHPAAKSPPTPAIMLQPSPKDNVCSVLLLSLRRSEYVLFVSYY
jgi:hypothetical protein